VPVTFLEILVQLGGQNLFKNHSFGGGGGQGKFVPKESLFAGVDYLFKVDPPNQDNN
jgi:hypothetical protein